MVINNQFLSFITMPNCMTTFFLHCFATYLLLILTFAALMSLSTSAPTQPDLVQIISRYILLETSRKALKGKCPFHKDQATSLMVYVEKNMFQCFGCGQGGGPIEFVMAIENKSREEAIGLITMTK